MKIDLNLEVLKSKSCKYLTIVDTSYYPVTPDSASLTIVPPGYEQSFLFNFGIRKANIYNSNSFGLTTADELNDLPDGLYTFHYVTCPITKDCDFYHMRTCKLRCRLAAQWGKYITACDNKGVLENLSEIDFLIKGAEAQADHLCNPNKAVELYIKADELLQRIEEPCLN